MSKKNNAVKAPKGPSYAGYRVITLLIALAPLAVFYFLGNAVFKFEGLEGASFFYVIKGLIENISANGINGIFIYGQSVLGYVKMAYTLLVPVVAIVNVILALIALFAKKTARGLSRTVAYLGFWAYAGYAIAIVTTCLYTSIDVPLDIVMYALAGVYLIYLIVLGFIKVGKKTWVALLLFLLNLAIAATLVYAICVAGNAGFAELLNESKIYTIVCAALIGCSAISLLISSARLLTKKGYCFDTVRYVFQLVVFVVLTAGIAINYFNLFDLSFLAFLDKFEDKALLVMLIAMGVATVVSVLQIIIASVAKGKKAKKAKKAKKVKEEAVAPVEEAPAQEEVVALPVVAEPVAAVEEEPVEEVEEEIVEEEPVEEVEEVVAPVIVEEEIEEENLTEDAFIATLTPAERAKFTDTFILKVRGKLNGIPDYVVGGDNKAFFRKVFVYLGQYRDVIPSDVLYKIYKYTQKN